ncbi:hypothetical protein Csa_017644 [Cucumis sativus]|nr:hypothetical protein Csa_017644 [Cucumis sativus]
MTFQAKILFFFPFVDSRIITIIIRSIKLVDFLLSGLRGYCVNDIKSSRKLHESNIQRPESNWVVTIYNLQTNSTLQAHCKSKDDDLGDHIINIKGQYGWGFKENFWQTTLFWCNFSSLNGHASFEVFWPEKEEWLESRCKSGICKWVATDEGLKISDCKFEVSRVDQTFFGEVEPTTTPTEHCFQNTNTNRYNRQKRERKGTECFIESTNGYNSAAQI